MSDSNPPREPGDPNDRPPVPPVPPAPTDAYGAGPEDQPTEAYGATSDDQQTRAYPPSDVQNTLPYASVSDVQPTQGYAGAAYPAATQSYSAHAPYGTGDTAATDTRPRTLALAAIIAAVLGLLLCLGGFIPVPGVSTVLVVIGGVLLLAAFVVSLIVLISKKQGGKGLGIAALVVSVLGGILFGIALFVSLIWLGLAAAGREDLTIPAEPDSSASALPSAEATEEASDEPSAEPSASAAPPASGTYDEAAYLAVVRPEINALIQEVQPGVTDEQLAEAYSDETLLALGQSFATLDSVEGGADLARTQFIEQSASVLTEEQATRFFDTVLTAAQQYLVQ